MKKESELEMPVAIKKTASLGSNGKVTVDVDKARALKTGIPVISIRNLGGLKRSTRRSV